MEGLITSMLGGRLRVQNDHRKLEEGPKAQAQNSTKKSTKTLYEGKFKRTKMKEGTTNKAPDY